MDLKAYHFDAPTDAELEKIIVPGAPETNSFFDDWRREASLSIRHRWGAKFTDGLYLLGTLEGKAAREAKLRTELGLPFEAEGPAIVTLSRKLARNPYPLNGVSAFSLRAALEGLTGRKTMGANELARHKEAQLARDLGTAPVVELHGLVKVRAGRVIGVYLGPHDMAEMLAVEDFFQQAGEEEGTLRVGSIRGVGFFMLDEDLP